MLQRGQAARFGGWNLPADARSPAALSPPATRTRPSCRRTAAWRVLGVLMLPVAVNVPVDGSNSSAVARTWVADEPPATSTFPFVSRVALATPRGIVIDPTRLQRPVAGSYTSADERTVPGAI